MKIKRIHHVALICSDYPKSKHFYVDVLGLAVVNETYRAERDSYKLDLKVSEGVQLELFSFPEPPSRVTRPEAAGLRHLAFEVDNLEDARAHLHSHGIESEPIRLDEITGKRFSFFYDPDKLPLELYEV